ncbi:MAG: ribosome biogenesis GTP-binding protein YihA/YsxC [Bacillota bacterium]
MVIKNATFIKSAAARDGFLDTDLPKIAVAGKSNVGKSSFINFIAHNTKLARTSNTPGRTRLVNYFTFNNDEFWLVDLPGYGYAKGSKVEIANWGQLMEDFFQEKKLDHVIFLVDIRHNPTADDKNMMQYLNYFQIPFTVIATKKDKIPKTKVKAHLAMICSDLGIGIDNIFAVSSEKRDGKELVMELFDKVISARAFAIEARKQIEQEEAEESEESETEAE